MRVVAGKYRGKNLLAPKDDKIRPTTTRIKETLFNVLQGYVDGAIVLDLFAGSGALGIEAISRGAKDVTFVDKSHDAIALVNENLKGIKEPCRIFNTDFLSALHGASVQRRKFDLIFIDPPYATSYGEMAIDKIVELDILADDGIIVFEHGAEKSYTISHKGFKQRTKEMGPITAEFITRKSVALMTGSFDPFTKGHEAVLEEALYDYDEVVVACLINEDKTYTFNNAQRLKIVEKVCENKKGAKAIFSDKFAVEVANEVGASVIVRGIRGEQDMAYEQEMADYNKEHGFDTRFITLDGYKEISSSIVRKQIREGDYRNIPACVIDLIRSNEFANLK